MSLSYFYMHSNPFKDTEASVPRKTAVYIKYTYTHLHVHTHTHTYKAFKPSTKSVYIKNDCWGGNDVSV